jgi:coproporphyrinogen III oxidase-like Fe-S oxidoreductase
MGAEGHGLVSFPETPATLRAEPVDRLTQMKDQMMLGLRLIDEGVRADAFERRFGENMATVFTREIADLVQRGLAEWVGENKTALRLTRRGIMVANRAFMEFV